MSGWPLLVLDFDGVICDSIDECFVSSWIAYHTLYKKDPPQNVSVALKKEFTRLRPYIRSGEDYLLIQEILQTGERVPDQATFESLLRKAGRDKMGRFKELFTQARTELLLKDRRFWLSLNRIYPHMLAAFAHLPREAPVHILSTKAPEFIAEILEYAQIHIPRDRILRSPSDKKLPVVEELRSSAGRERAIFIDDQIDYLLGSVFPRIEAYLASWGYVKEEWLTGKLPVSIISSENLVRLIEKEFPPDSR
jgi:phosphoglycolate phosphatase-like HAD superfamily hydrolase